MKWRLSVHGAIVVMAIGVSSVAVAQPRANDGTTLGQLTSIKVATERTAGFKPSLFTSAVSRSVAAVSVANIVTAREAWESGAWSWSASKRKSFMNDRADMTMLALVRATSVQQRGDKDPAGWIPSTSSSICVYLGNWVAVKTRWGLAMDQREFVAVRTAFTQRCSTPTTSTSVAPTTSSITVTTTTGKPTIVGSALALLQTIRVQNEYQVGYDRALFEHWRDIDGDGCDSRDQV